MVRSHTVSVCVCVCVSHWKHRNPDCDVIYLEKPFVEIKEPWKKVLEVNVGDQFTTIPVKYSAYPEPGFKWYDPTQQPNA